MSGKKYRKSVSSLDKRILEHKEKISTAENPELADYWKREIEKLKRERKKKAKWL